MNDAISKYLEEIQSKFKTGHAREHAYRPALQQLIQNINSSINAVNDPKQQKVGAPDFLLLKGKIPIGYIEAKDIDIDLDKELKSRNQVNRYKASLNNLCFTNYLEFRFYLNGEETARVEVARLVDNKIEIFENKIAILESLLKNFTLEKAVTIKSSKDLALLMANKAKMLKNTLYLSLEDETTQDGQVEKQYETFKQMLIHDLSKEQFADIYSQTVAYGMFAARYHDDSIETFNRDEANKLLPKSNPFLRNFFQSIAGYNIDQRIEWMVDDLADLFNHVNVKELLEDFGKSTKREDVIVHFYETFLAEYDSKLRKARGVYYTPEPVVDFIVRAVDDILKDEFGIKDGLADTQKIEIEKTVEVQGKRKKQKVMEHRVQVLDPATGTGTFLDQVIKFIYNSKFKGQEGLWQSYVDDHLLPRLHGFEILMASYAMAHLKLDITLSETGYDFNKGKGKRLGVYLTNSLEEPEASQRDLFSQWLSQESEEANEVKKEKPIMVVIGNPPYSGESSNKGEWIMNLMDDYKYEPGGKVKLKEKNPKWINDDYVKFIRFAQYFIEKNGEGVLAFINPHGFLDNPTFRGMRWKLQDVFDKIYTIDLHGNTKKKEVSPDGTKDENVFDIQQGVSINIFVKGKKDVVSKKLAKVSHYDLYGKRQLKYDFLNSNSIDSIRWNELEPQAPQQFFVKKDFELLKEYEEGLKVNELFPVNGTGILTKRDELCIQRTEQLALQSAKDILELSKEDFYKKYNLPKDVRDWRYEWAIGDIKKSNLEASSVKPIAYRPFDNRFIYYTGRSRGFMGWPVYKVMQHFLKGDNIGLSFIRINKEDYYSGAFITKNVSEARLADRFITNIAPLYEYQTDLDRNGLIRLANLNLKLIEAVSIKLNFKFIPDHEHPDANKPGTFHPVDVLDYIYAILHSPTYRERYKEFLKIDFPRVPFTSNQKLFWDLVKKGSELRQYHLMEHQKSNDLITSYPQPGENEVVKVEYKNNRVYINENQYFENVPEIAWNFYIGGYQPAQKWLKDRKGRKLTFEDIIHYQKIIVALTNTDRIMKEIDALIPEWPIK